MFGLGFMSQFSITSFPYRFIQLNERQPKMQIAIRYLENCPLVQKAVSVSSCEVNRQTQSCVQYFALAKKELLPLYHR